MTKHATCQDAHAMVQDICAPYIHRTTVKTEGTGGTGGMFTGGNGGTGHATGGTGGSGSGWNDYTLLVTNLYCYEVKREVPKNSDELLNLAWCEVLFIAWNTEGT